MFSETHPPRTDKIYKPSSLFWVCPGVSYHFVVPRKPPREGTQEAYSLQMSELITFFDEIN